MEKHLIINHAKVSFSDEKTLLEVIRKANIELPTFCYIPELKVYGACRLCMVEIEGMGIVSACSTAPEDGMKVKTNNDQIREIRKIIVELLMANHNRDCMTCSKSGNCQLQTLAADLGIYKTRFKNVVKEVPKDTSTYSLVRDTSKCVLCGNCVRFCDYIQGTGAIDFSGRSSKTKVCSGLGKDLNSSDCVYCGQCARVCPTGALVPKSEVSAVEKILNDESKKAIAAIAPSVRAGIGEAFGLAHEDASTITGKIVTALRMLGFAKVYDISFTADMTIVEEAAEFAGRLSENKNMPLFTSCCPAWVKFVEQYYPEFIPNLSTARSPQGMFGSIVKELMSQELKVTRENLPIVSVMPCTAKKFEAKRPELSKNGSADIDFVLTTQELARMIKNAGIKFEELGKSSFDMPFGFKTGGGVIFGNSGGVTEAV
jgi:NADH-quinone oxidoreductase subunit G